jgi:hypothetical protein
VKAEAPAESLARLDVNEEHPCGRTATVPVTRIPLADPALEGELVLEVAEDGQEVRRWTVPVDVPVFGVRGDELVVRLPDGTSLGIRPDGTFRLVPELLPALPEPVTCPDLARFRGSAYLRCWPFTDLDGGERRLLAYQGPCT